MEKLTHEQISAVIDWMNTWEQLKDTVIPIRFKEDFTRQLTIKPPIGVMPKWLHDEQRKQSVLSAIIRYADAGLKIPEQWISEYNESCVK